MPYKLLLSSTYNHPVRLGAVIILVSREIEAQNEGKLLFYSLNCLATLVKSQLTKKKKNQLTTNVRVYLWMLNYIPFTCMSILVPVPFCLDYRSFAIDSEVRKCQSSFVLFFVFTHLCCLQSPYKFFQQLINLCKKGAGILTETVLNLSISLGILPSQECCRPIYGHALLSIYLDT